MTTDGDDGMVYYNDDLNDAGRADVGTTTGLENEDGT